MKFPRWTIVLLLAGPGALAQTSVAQPESSMAAEIASLLEPEEMANAWWGALVVDVQTGAALYEHNGDRSFMPASVVKLFTTAAALEALGPSFTFHTRLFATGEIVNGRLHGDLVIRGSGDPTFGALAVDAGSVATFRAWADSLRRHGIAHITGNIIGDDDIFDDVRLGHSWSWDDVQYGYSAEISGLSFHNNVVELRVAPARIGAPGRISWDPIGTDYVRIINLTRTMPRGTALREGYKREPGTNLFEVSSEVPTGRLEKEAISVRNPTLYFVHTLLEVLRSEGIAVDGMPVDVDDVAGKPDYDRPEVLRVASHVSILLSEIAREINKESSNLWAEQVLRTLGVASESPGSAKKGLRRAGDTFVRAGIDTTQLQLVDGSGLSRKNLVTPLMATKLLRYMARHKDSSVRDAFLASLAVGGVDGTLENRFQGGRPPIRAKTGSLGNVSTLSGFVTTREGKELAFALFCNHFTVETSVIRKAQDAVVALLGSLPLR